MMDYSNLSQLIGSNFRILREKKGYSQEEVADALDKAAARVSEFESGKPILH